MIPFTKAQHINLITCTVLASILFLVFYYFVAITEYYAGLGDQTEGALNITAVYILVSFLFPCRAYWLWARNDRSKVNPNGLWVWIFVPPAVVLIKALTTLYS